MIDGGIIWYRTRTGSGGRGVDFIDRLVIGEAQHAQDEQLASVTPTLLAIPNPQMDAIGTAALAGKSDWWWKIRRRALSDDPGAFGYVGHTAERVWLDDDGKVVQERPDVEDRAVWLASNPAIVAGRGQGLAFLEEQFRNLGPDMFAQEHLCVWAPPADDAVSRLVDLDRWRSLAQLSEIVSGRRWALATSADRQWSCLAAAGRRDDGRYHVESVEHAAGVSWVVERCVRAFETLRIPLLVASGGAAGSLIGELVEAGVEVEEVSAGDYARSAGVFIDAVREGGLVHLDQRSLTRSVELADTRTTSSGATVWVEPDRADISPLAAATLALGAVAQEQTPDVVPLGAWR